MIPIEPRRFVLREHDIVLECASGIDQGFGDVVTVALEATRWCRGSEYSSEPPVMPLFCGRILRLLGGVCRSSAGCKDGKVSPTGDVGVLLVTVILSVSPGFTCSVGILQAVRGQVKQKQLSAGRIGRIGRCLIGEPNVQNAVVAEQSRRLLHHTPRCETRARVGNGWYRCLGESTHWRYRKGHYDKQNPPHHVHYPHDSPPRAGNPFRFARAIPPDSRDR